MFKSGIKDGQICASRTEQKYYRSTAFNIPQVKMTEEQADRLSAFMFTQKEMHSKFWPVKVCGEGQTYLNCLDCKYIFDTSAFISIELVSATIACATWAYQYATHSQQSACIAFEQ